MPQLDTDCLNEVFKYLEDDRVALHSCLLVNRLWCEVSVRILWRSILNYNTLIACLPNESKEILYKNEIVISTPISKPPLFNYVTFIRNISIFNIIRIIKIILKNYRYKKISPSSLDHKKYLVAQEIYKYLMNQIPSLRKLDFHSFTAINVPNVTFTSYPGAKDCLKDLSVLYCRSDIYPGFFYQLSQVCHNIQSLDILLERVISNGLTNLISVQQNLKYLYVMQSCDCKNLTNIIPSLKKLSNTLIKLKLYEFNVYLSFIAEFINLQELILSFYSYTWGSFDPFEGFNELQDVTFPRLQILKFTNAHPRIELLIKFLENNGKNLIEFYISKSLTPLNLAISKFCPNIKKFSTIVLNYCELKPLEEIFDHCQCLESIKVWCDNDINSYSERELLKVIAEYSPENFYELKLYYTWDAQSGLLPKELESFFISWKNRTPQKLLSLVIDGEKSFDKNIENMKIIKKYIKLGVITYLSHQ